MNTKPYVAKLGIRRDKIKVMSPHGEVTLSSYAPTVYGGKNVIFSNKYIAGQRVGFDLDRDPEIKLMLDDNNAKFERDFEERYPGIYELVSARNDSEYKYDRMMCEIENGNGRLSNPRPDQDPDDVAKQYPIADAYLTICSYCDAQNVNKSSAGQWAVAQLLDGADVIETKDAMVKRWSDASSKFFD